MRKLPVILFLLATLVLATKAWAEVSINLGLVTKPGGNQNIAADKFKELVEQRSGGGITVKIHHSGSLGSETEILQQIQLNQVQMGVITVGPFDTFEPTVMVIGYPFIFKDYAQTDAVLDGPLGREILKSLEKVGFKGLAFSENGFRNLTNNKRPVRTAEDVMGLKIRVMESALDQAIWRALGANPTPMPWPIYTELEQGVIDGQENPLWVIEEYKLYEVQKYMTLTRHVYSGHIDVASLTWWNTLAPEQQDLIGKAMSEAAVYQRGVNRERNAARLSLLQEKGMQIEENPDLGSFRAKVAGLKDMDLYKESKVKALLERVLQATR
ncbi:MAG: TRAP transporter substrate-binding protein [Thermodesulfobacteriota bacterium]